MNQYVGKSVGFDPLLIQVGGILGLPHCRKKLCLTDVDKTLSEIRKDQQRQKDNWEEDHVSRAITREPRLYERRAMPGELLHARLPEDKLDAFRLAGNKAVDGDGFP